MGTPAHTLAEVRQSLIDGTQTVRSHMVHTLARIEAGAPSAWISLVPAHELLQQAEALDARLRAEGPGLFQALPLLGLPFAVKDNIDVAGLPTTAACKAWAQGPAARHAHAVQRLVLAGAIPVGKTNLDQFATGLVGTRSPYGAVPNVFDGQRISGGSSSGSAHVVATGQVPFALGTDTAGSGRVPAGLNNIVGLKPTPGRVGTSGVVPACRSLDCVSVFALTVADAAEVLATLEGPDPLDDYSSFSPGPARWPTRLRVAVPREPLFTGDAGYAEVYAHSLAQLQAQGHTVLPIDLAPLLATAQLLYSGPWVAERHAVVQTLLQQQPDAFDPTVRQVIEAALQYSATDAFEGQYTLRAAQRQHAALWQAADVLMVPTACGHPRLSEVAADPLGENAQLGHYTNFVNLLGWCALALPAGFTAAGLPFGLTFIAPAQHDAALAHWGQQWQQQLALPLGALGGASSAHPAPWREPASQPTLAIAVVGAHLSGLPLNGQLTERGATLVHSTTTHPSYRLFALPGTTPPKPGLQRVAQGGAAIALEVWQMPMAQVGSFLALIPPPLGLGNVQLADGRWVHGFVCEAWALEGAQDITGHGGWRGYLAALNKRPP
jgi:allophanate hydrolase